MNSREKGFVLAVISFVVLCLGCKSSSEKKYSKEKIYKVATYNLRYQNKRDDISGHAWNERKGFITRVVTKYDFDIFGVQEPFFNQVNDLLGSLKGYQRFGTSDDEQLNSKTNHHHDIFYKTALFDLLDNGSFWLSPGVPTTAPENLYQAAWGGKAKVCTWGKFKDKVAGHVFYLFNTHFFYENEEVRNNSASLILEQIKSIACDFPAIFMGDLNLNPYSKAYKILNDSELLEDSYNWARINEPKDTLRHHTFNNWQIDVNATDVTRGDRRIDYIFLTKQWKDKVNSHSIVWDTYKKEGVEKMPSDHNPIMVELKFSN
ncbi:endonuclease/exonuclease/phosphatase family protein [Aestuariivivens insulae]|uniref:endonuclease/exonuclease/phosphatase family protein n=1 Tax=Aestuariivivens insulae TaxID=1621988 RepID=UPI001F560040|nr:endonuclease/exonuclease/phosphatase family protein [Aestuariivivens insulae]